MKKMNKIIEILKTNAPNLYWIARTRNYQEWLEKETGDNLTEEEYYIIREIYK